MFNNLYKKNLKIKKLHILERFITISPVHLRSCWYPCQAAANPGHYPGSAPHKPTTKKLINKNHHNAHIKRNKKHIKNWPPVPHHETKTLPVDSLLSTPFYTNTQLLSPCGAKDNSSAFPNHAHLWMIDRRRYIYTHNKNIHYKKINVK